MKILLTDGDSWTFGSELPGPDLLINPAKGFSLDNLKPGLNDYDSHNDHYRIPRIWPTLLAKKLGVQNINLAFGAKSNDSIVSDTIGWILRNYIVPKKDTSELFVIVSWTSPERKNIFIEDYDKTIAKFTFWPNMPEVKYYGNDIGKKYFHFYKRHLWLEREYITRFVEQNFTLEMFCKTYNIPHLMFNAFYSPRNLEGMENWTHLDIDLIIDNWEILSSVSHITAFTDHDDKVRIKDMWNTIPEDTFINKNKPSGTFKGYIDANVDKAIRMNHMHPSAESHKVWADFLETKINK